jgi:hypothetical protein
MRIHRVAAFTVLATAAVALAGCGSTRQALGMAKTTPDEFRVVTKAPLVVPPEYALRPPAPGEPRPQELQPESAARAALLGERLAADRTPGEAALVNAAGAARADPLARYVVDDEFGDLAYKEKSFADRVMFWRKDQPETQQPIADANTGVDPAAEAERLKALTGGREVVIRRQGRGLKLPGL